MHPVPNSASYSASICVLTDRREWTSGLMRTLFGCCPYESGLASLCPRAIRIDSKTSTDFR
jgi:hypothetical protein